MFAEPCLPLGIFLFNKCLNVCGCASPPRYLLCKFLRAAIPSCLYISAFTSARSSALQKHHLLLATAREWKCSRQWILCLIYWPHAIYLCTAGCTAPVQKSSLYQSREQVMSAMSAWCFSTSRHSEFTTSLDSHSAEVHTCLMEMLSHGLLSTIT